MACKAYVVYVTVSISLLSGHVGGVADSVLGGLQVPGVIQECVDKVPALWPEAWRREYIETMHRAMAPDPNGAPTTWHLEALGEGFTRYWKGLVKNQDRAFFEIQLAEIRWYTEHLIRASSPSAEDTRKRRDQWKRLSDHGASLLLTQFPFLDPSIVQKAQADHLVLCYHHIDAPLVPVFGDLLSDTQVEQVKKRWHDLRYARVDIWNRLGGEAMISLDGLEAMPVQEHPHYLLTQQSLAQFQAHVQAIAIVPCDHYRDALRHYTEAQLQRRKSLSQARRAEHRLERDHAGQLLQVEHLGFLLTALLETGAPVVETSSVEEQQQDAPRHHDDGDQRR